MSNVINRLDLTLLLSVNTPDYSTIDWIINPDLSSVRDVDPRYWTISGDNVIEMTRDQKITKDAADLPALKRAKAERIDIHTDILTASFTYSGLQFSMIEPDRLKILAADHFADLLTYPKRWNTLDNVGHYDIMNTAAMHEFAFTALVDTLASGVDSGTVLKNQIRDATTILGLDAVVDNR